MSARPRVLIDLNIILDVLQKRQPFFETSARLLAYAETGRVQGLIAAHTITTLVYLIGKDQSPVQARAIITNLLQFLRVAPVDQKTIEQALSLNYRDFEDAVQMTCAVHGRADFLVTRNVKDFQPALLPIVQPVELLAALEPPAR